MERSEPTLVPEWLRKAGSLNGGRSASHSDQGAPKFAKNKSFLNSNGHDFGRSFSSERTTSTYFRRGSSNNSSGLLRLRGSYGRNQHFMDRGKNTYVSQSMVSGKHEDTWHKKDNANGSLAKGKSIGGLNRTAFAREFPSLKAEDKTGNPVPGSSSVIHSLPVGTSTVGEKWTSALAEVPVLVRSKSSTSVALGTTSTGLNMAEAVAQGPSRAQTAPQLSVGTQRLEELAIKQSRQLIPVIPSTSRTLLSNDKKKNKVSQQHHSGPGPTKVDSSKVASTRAPVINPLPDRKPVLTVLERKPSSQAQSRNDFFNSVRKKSMGNLSGAHSSENEGDSICKEDAQMQVSNGKKHPRCDPRFSEEEEAAFLRSLGWEEEEDDQEGGLTEEEINAFYKEYIKSNPSLKILQGAQPRFLSPFHFHMRDVAGISSERA